MQTQILPDTDKMYRLVNATPGTLHIFPIGLVRVSYGACGSGLAKMICRITLWPNRNDSHFADDIFRRIFLNENALIFTRISLMFVPEDPIKNNGSAPSHYLNTMSSQDQFVELFSTINYPKHIIFIVRAGNCSNQHQTKLIQLKINGILINRQRL